MDAKHNNARSPPRTDGRNNWPVVSDSKSTITEQQKNGVTFEGRKIEAWDRMRYRALQQGIFGKAADRRAVMLMEKVV